MYLCPENYCCQEAVCHDFHSCAPHRTGTLCGRCEQGYSESLFETACIPNNECTYMTWFWGIIILYGIFYVLFFIFEEECDALVKVFSLWAREKTSACFAVFSKTRTSHATPASSNLRVAMERRMTSHHKNVGRRQSNSYTMQRPTPSEMQSTGLQEEEEQEGAFLQIFMYYIQVNPRVVGYVRSCENGLSQSELCLLSLVETG